MPNSVIFEFRTAEHAAQFIAAVVRATSEGPPSNVELSLNAFGYFIVKVSGFCVPDPHYVEQVEELIN